MILLFLLMESGSVMASHRQARYATSMAEAIKAESGSLVEEKMVLGVVKAVLMLMEKI